MHDRMSSQRLLRRATLTYVTHQQQGSPSRTMAELWWKNLETSVERRVVPASDLSDFRGHALRPDGARGGMHVLAPCRCCSVVHAGVPV